MPNPVIDQLVIKRLSRYLIKDIFRQCKMVCDASGEPLSVEYIYKYPQSVDQLALDQAVEEFIEKKEMIFRLLNFDLCKLVEAGDW